MSCASQNSEFKNERQVGHFRGRALLAGAPRARRQCARPPQLQRLLRPALKRARQRLLASRGVLVLDADIMERLL